MKKPLAFVLALGLAVSTSVTAFAEDAATADTNDSTKNTEIAVNGSYQAGTPAGSNISVDVVWDNMSFTYTGESKGAWNPKTHQYGDTIEAHWAWSSATDDKTAPNITLTNHSDTGVKATFTFNSPIGGLTGTFTGADGNPLTDNALTLPTALKTDPDKAPSAVTSFSIGGSGIDKDQQLGSIIVAVAKDGATGGDTPTTDQVTVTTFDDLSNAISNAQNDKTIALGEDITTDQCLNVRTNANIVIDFANHTLTSSADNAITINNGTLTLKNGTLSGTGNYPTIHTDASDTISLVAENMTVTSTNSLALNLNSGVQAKLTNCKLIAYSENEPVIFMNKVNTTLMNCTLTSNAENTILLGGKAKDSPDDATASTFYDSTLTIGGTTTISHNIAFYPDCVSTCTIVVQEGCEFNPEEHYDPTQNTMTNKGSGTWTITAGATGGDEDESGAILVSDADKLTQAILDSKNSIKLTENIQLSAGLDLENYSGTIDLNDKTLTIADSNAITSDNANISINNGTIEGFLTVGTNANVVVNSCNITSNNKDSYAVMVLGNATLNNCTINNTVYSRAVALGPSSRLTLSGNTIITTNSTDFPIAFGDEDVSLICLAGTYNFDPTAYVDKTAYTVTSDGSGTWTVAESTTGGETAEA